MQIPRVQLKMAANEKLRLRGNEPIWITLVFMLISGTISSMSGGTNISYENNSLGYFFSYDVLAIIGILLSGAALVGAAYQIFVGNVITFGYTLYTRRISAGESASIRDLFLGFRRFSRVVLVYFLTGLFVSLWSLLLVFPGIMAYYRYRFAPYILMENPDISAMDAIRASKAMTCGYKGALFVLDLSFLGWFILIALTMGILGCWKLPYYYISLSETYFYIKSVTPQPGTAPNEFNGGAQ